MELLRAGISPETLKQLSEEDVWLYYFVLQKQNEFNTAAATEAAMRMRNG